MRCSPIRVASVLIALCALDLRAATITWSSPTNISGDTDVSTLGTLVKAYNLGTTGVASTTVNGVNFTGLALSGLSLTDGNFTFAHAAGLGGINSVGAGSGPFVGLSPAYQAMLGSLGGNASGGTMTLSMAGLTVGSTYQFQWWSNQSSGPFSNFTTTAAAGNTVTLDRNTIVAVGGLGQYATGSFVADSTTQVISFAGTPNTGVNGLQLRDLGAANGGAVPLPAALLPGILLGAGMLARATRRFA